MLEQLHRKATVDGQPLAEASDLLRPLVSILVRSMGRPSLASALTSIAQQTYRPIEVVVINAAGNTHPLLPDINLQGIALRLEGGKQPLTRACAANRALETARGRWLMFLDDDDTIDPDHVERLHSALQSHPDVRVAHAGVRLVDQQGQQCGLLDDPVDRVGLWMANRLAIHAALFSKELVDAGLRFDETFLVYEDWDFWFRMARQESFLHVPGVSATYRLTGTSGTTEHHDLDTSRRLRAPFYRKWLATLDELELEQLAARGEHARQDLQTATRQLHETRTSALARQADLHGEVARLGGEVSRLEARLLDSQRRLDESQADSRKLNAWLTESRQALMKAERERERVIADSSREREQLTAEFSREREQVLATYADLERGYRALTSSLSWRVTGPLRSLRRLADADGRVELLRRIWHALPFEASSRLQMRNWLLQRNWGRKVLRQVSPYAVSAQPSPAPPPTDKERVRAEAEAALGEFLASNGRIDLNSTGHDPEVSVVVVLFNQAGLSRLCLQSLADSEGVSFEVLVVDNGSSDRVPRLLERVDGALVLRPGENLGFLRAVNLAARQARGRHLVLLNNDAMVEPLTLRHAVDRLRADPGAGAVGGPILLWNGQLQEAGSIIWRDGSCQGYGRGDDPSRPEYRFVRDVDYCSGAFLMIRRELFSSLGGFDSAFVPAYYEESDLCARLWEQGHRIVYDPQVRIRHFEFASEVSPGWAVELQQRNRALFVQRHQGFLAAQPCASAQGAFRARARIAAGRRRVLVIDDRVPLPWLGQGYPRAASWISAMAAQGHAVTHYPLQFPREHWSDVRRALPETVEVILDHGEPALADFLVARQGTYDAVIVSRPHNMLALRKILEREPALLGHARLIYDAEALFSVRDIARAALDGQPLHAEEQRRRIEEELTLTRETDAVIAVSEAEAKHFRSAGYQRVEVLGHAVEAVCDTPGFGTRRDFLFVGALTADDTPNSDSVRWFVAEVWPTIRAALGEGVRLHLVGTCEAPSVRKLAAPDVILHGRAESLAAHLDKARVFVVPTRYAAGIPHKAHEAGARGLPMVVTPLIAGQLGWDDLVATGSDAASFAKACTDLYGNENAWHQQRRQLFSAVERDCSPRAFAQAVARVLDWDAPPNLDQTADPQPVDEPQVEEQALLKAEVTTDEARTAELWGRDAAQREDLMRQRRHWSSHPVTAAEINRLICGEPSVGWVEHLKRTRFPQTRARGLSLGCGAGAVVIDALRLGIVHHMDGVDLSGGAIAVATTRAAGAGVGDRARFQVSNVNEMPIRGPLDLIIFEQSLHHVDALGTVLDHCADALAPDGLLVINEYVGPDRFQWSDEAQRLMNAILERLPMTHRRHPDDGSIKPSMQRVSPQAVIDLDPSEAIHSSAILDALEARFANVEKREFGGTLLQFLLADIAANFDPDDVRDVALLRLMTLLETELIRCGAIGSDFVYAVYQHRNASDRIAA